MADSADPTIEQAIDRALAADPGYRGPVKVGDVADAYHDFDPDVGLDVSELVAFLEETQPLAWGGLVSSHSSQEAAYDTVGARLADELDRRGIIDVMSQGVDLSLGERGEVHLDLSVAADSPDVANRFTATRRLRYDPRSTRTTDLGLFVNGILVATAELGGPGSSDDAKERYRLHRNPAIAALARAIAHFAIDDERVFVATRLAGAETRFVPLIPSAPAPAGCPSSEFLWNEFWHSEAWLGHLARMAAEARPGSAG